MTGWRQHRRNLAVQTIARAVAGELLHSLEWTDDGHITARIEAPERLTEAARLDVDAALVRLAEEHDGTHWRDVWQAHDLLAAPTTEEE